MLSAGRSGINRMVFEGEEPPGSDDCPGALVRTAWTARLGLVPGQDSPDKMTIEATLRILHHPAAPGEDGTFFPAFTDYRPVDAVRR